MVGEPRVHNALQLVHEAGRRGGTQVVHQDVNQAKHIPPQGALSERATQERTLSNTHTHERTRAHAHMGMLSRHGGREHDWNIENNPSALLLPGQ